VDFKIYIPSFGRAGKVTTTKFIPSAVVVCPESQAKEYKKHHDRIFTIPTKRDGTVSKKRNAILDLTPEKKIVMVDDDLKKIFYIPTRQNFSEEMILFYCEEGFRLCEEMGFFYFGFNWDAQPLHLDMARLIRTNKFFYCFQGVIKSEIRCDEKLKKSDDIDFWLQHTMRDRGTVRFEHVHAKFLMGREVKTQAGGIKEKEQSGEEVKYMLGKWGRGCLGVGKDGQLWPIRSPFKGI
jgi:hypothetical protein